MSDISIPRLLRTALVLGAGGALIILIRQGPRDATGFLVGAALAWITVRSWGKVLGNLGAVSVPSAWFLALRYVVIAAALYVTMRVLGSSPVAIVLGLLVSFAAVLVEIIFCQRAGAKQ